MTPYTHLQLVPSTQKMKEKGKVSEDKKYLASSDVIISARYCNDRRFAERVIVPENSIALTMSPHKSRDFVRRHIRPKMGHVQYCCYMNVTSGALIPYIIDNAVERINGRSRHFFLRHVSFAPGEQQHIVRYDIGAFAQKHVIPCDTLIEIIEGQTCNGETIKFA